MPGTQHCQMLRDIGLFEVKSLMNSTHGHLALIAQQLNDGDSGWMRQCPNNHRLEATKVVLHSASPRELIPSNSRPSQLLPYMRKCEYFQDCFASVGIGISPRSGFAALG